MSDSQRAFSGFDAYNNTDYAKQSQGLDFFSFHSPSDILAPHPDLFESELDSSLAALDEVQLQLLTVDSSDAYTYLRSDTPTCGPPSTITVSSESAYDSLSSRSESFYNYAQSNYSLPLDLDMEFQKFRVDDFAAVANSNALPATVDPNSFGALPPTPPRSPELTATNAKFNPRSSFSDYSPMSSSSSDYYGHLGFRSGSMGQSTVAPSNVSNVPIVPSRPVHESDDIHDPRKKYKCNTCPRAFARAYNLKTHMATHDPNRLKPHVCPHRSCSRSFSRKHDLGRHLVSIHRDGSLCSSHHSSSAKKSIGVEKGPRGWCEGCGKGWIGRESNCDCSNVK